MFEINDNESDDLPNDGGEAITLDEFTEFVGEIEDQPTWRGRADKEMDYVDGNQLDSDLLQKQKALGIPPAMENIIAPQIQAVEGYEAKTRKDWRVTPDGDPDGVDVADALNHRLNQAERHSGADAACAEAFHGQLCVGLAWVEVSRNSNPFEFPYRCKHVRRGEIWWDMLGEEKRSLKDARWMIRGRWVDPKRLAAAFPDKKDLLKAVSCRWAGNWDMTTDGNVSTGLGNSWNTERSWTVDEQNWWSDDGKRARIYEVWYRRWVNIPVLRIPGTFGNPARVVEFDEDNPAHTYAAATGVGKIERAVIPRMRRAYFLGPHKLHDGPTPYAHNDFPYVPFMHNLEDNTGVPYGVVRSMIYPQDSLNAGISKLRWGMASVRVERTKGAVAMDDATFRKQVARVDADIVLDPTAMAQPGARFTVNRDFQLNEQQFKLLEDNRASIVRSSGVSDAFQGRNGTATSGLQEQTQVEQATQSLAGLMDRFSWARSKVGELLLSMIVTDIGANQETVVIDGDPLKPTRTVVLNKPEIDPSTGLAYLSNDVQRMRLKVSLEDVASTASFRAQQLNAMSEVIKSLPPSAQAATVPFLVALMDIPHRNEVIEAVQKAVNQESPEAIEQRIQTAVSDALAKAGHDLKEREVAIKEKKVDAEVQEIINRAVQTGVQAAYSAMQAGQVIAQMPQVAPIADEVMKASGYRSPNPAGADPNFPMPASVNGAPMGAPVDVQKNTSPAFPPVPQHPGSGMNGIETPQTADNFQ